MKKTNYCIITTTIDDKKISDVIIDSLLKKHLVACVQVSNIKSHYRWRGMIEKSDEILLQFKTKKSLYKEVKIEIEKLHTYDIPEIIMSDIVDLNNSYLEWMEEELIK